MKNKTKLYRTRRIPEEKHPQLTGDVRGALWYIKLKKTKTNNVAHTIASLSFRSRRAANGGEVYGCERKLRLKKEAILLERSADCAQLPRERSSLRSTRTGQVRNRKRHPGLTIYASKQAARSNAFSYVVRVQSEMHNEGRAQVNATSSSALKSVSRPNC